MGGDTRYQGGAGSFEVTYMGYLGCHLCGIIQAELVCGEHNIALRRLFRYAVRAVNSAFRLRSRC